MDVRESSSDEMRKDSRNARWLLHLGLLDGFDCDFTSYTSGNTLQRANNMRLFATPQEWLQRNTDNSRFGNCKCH